MRTQTLVQQHGHKDTSVDNHAWVEPGNVADVAESLWAYRVYEYAKWWRLASLRTRRPYSR